MLITYNELRDLIYTKNMLSYPNKSIDPPKDIPLANINSASVDVTLGEIFKFEVPTDATSIDPRKKNDIFGAITTNKNLPVLLQPKTFVLSETQELFNMPDDVACEFKLKSSLARCGVTHSLAGWGEPSWVYSTMTLELYNLLDHHAIELHPGMKIGQIIFWRGDDIPESALYRNRGQYNNQVGVQESKGVK